MIFFKKNILCKKGYNEFLDIYFAMRSTSTLLIFVTPHLLEK